MDMNLESNELLEAIRAEFPKEFTIAVQRIHIRKLEEKLLEAQAFNEVVKETNG